MFRARESTPGLMWLAVMAGAALLTAAPCYGDDEAPREYSVKAAFIYNFTQFIDWPADAFAAGDSPFVVAVVGQNPFGAALDRAMANKTVGKHPIVVKYFATANDLGTCQLLFVSASLDKQLGEIFAKKTGKAVLNVGESDEFMRAGGAIRLFLEEDHVKFEIAPDVCEAARLKVSAKLMKLARIYKK